MTKNEFDDILKVCEKARLAQVRIVDATNSTAIAIKNSQNSISQTRNIIVETGWDISLSQLLLVQIEFNTTKT